MNYPIKILSQLRPILRGFRKARHLTQAELAKKLGITQQSYAQLEANPASASLERLFKVLQLLEVDLVLADKPIEEKIEETQIGQPTKILKNNQSNVEVEKISPNYSSQSVHFKSSPPLDTPALKALMGTSFFDFNRIAEVDKYKLAGLGLDDSMKSIAEMAKISGISSASDLATKALATDFTKIAGNVSAKDFVNQHLKSGIEKHNTLASASIERAIFGNANALEIAKASGLTSPSELATKALATDFTKIVSNVSAKDFIDQHLKSEIEKHTLALTALDYLKKEKW